MHFDPDLYILKLLQKQPERLKKSNYDKELIGKEYYHALKLTIFFLLYESLSSFADKVPCVPDIIMRTVVLSETKTFQCCQKFTVTFNVKVSLIIYRRQS